MSRTKKDNSAFVAWPHSVATDEECVNPKYRSADYRSIKPKADGRRHLVVGQWPNLKVVTFQYM